MRRPALFDLRLPARQILAAVAFAVACAPALAGGDGSSRTFAFASEAEASVVRTIMGLKESGLRQAISDIDEALSRTPNFRLGHLIHGDLLMARAGRPVAFGDPASAVPGFAPLQEEARARLRRHLDAPPMESLPGPVLQHAPSQAHSILVDTSRSRLFVFANDAGRPRYVTDFYISLGKNGIDKQREGDQKTPVGIYTIVAAKDKVPDLYGTGAFPISYPNEWDRRHGRNGHGIWLHGTPSETYSRPPFATDGCVALANDDFQRLARYVNVGRTPVVIGTAIAWREPGRWESDREEFLATFQTWRADWESLDTERYLSHYGSGFRSESKDRSAWVAQKRRVNAGKRWIKVGVSQVSLFAFPTDTPMMVVSFEQDYRSQNLSKRTLKRQYWTREDGRWKIVHESVVAT